MQTCLSQTREKYDQCADNPLLLKQQFQWPVVKTRHQSLLRKELIRNIIYNMLSFLSLSCIRWRDQNRQVHSWGVGTILKGDIRGGIRILIAHGPEASDTRYLLTGAEPCMWYRVSSPRSDNPLFYSNADEKQGNEFNIDTYFSFEVQKILHLRQICKIGIPGVKHLLQDLVHHRHQYTLSFIDQSHFSDDDEFIKLINRSSDSTNFPTGMAGYSCTDSGVANWLRGLSSSSEAS